jgi:hypothetical protein
MSFLSQKLTVSFVKIGLLELSINLAPKINQNYEINQVNESLNVVVIQMSLVLDVSRNNELFSLDIILMDSTVRTFR